MPIILDGEPYIPTLSLVTCDIFVKTYSGDRGYHPFMLKSIDKYCTDFRNTVVVTGEHPRGYLHQQVVKLHADQHTDADLILVTDSDTLFCRPVTPETYLVDGKPIWLHTPFNEEMLAHPGTRAWFNVMREFFGEDPPSEGMRRQPFVFPAWILKNLRAYCIQKHGVSLSDYIMSKKAFSEWNVLFMFAWKFHHDAFHWINTETDPLPELTCHQFWSHTPIAENLAEIQSILA